MLYCPNSSGIVYVLLYVLPTPLTSVIISVLLFGSVMFANTLSTPIASLTFACTVIIVAVLYVSPAGFRSVTSGGAPSSLTKNVVIVLFMLLLVSFAMNVMLYCPSRSGIV